MNTYFMEFQNKLDFMSFLSQLVEGDETIDEEPTPTDEELDELEQNDTLPEEES